MPKLRVYEVAKELNINSKKILEKLSEFNIDVKNHMSTIDELDVKRIRSLFGNGLEKAEKPKQVIKAPTKPAEKPAAGLPRRQGATERSPAALAPVSP